MQFRLENPEHQKTAIHSVVDVFRGMEKNTYDNATTERHLNYIRKMQEKFYAF